MQTISQTKDIIIFTDKQLQVQVWMLIKLIKTNVSKKKILRKRKPKSLSEKSEQNNKTI